MAQGYDFADFAFITTSEGVIAIDAGTSEQRARNALADLSLPPGTPVSHLIITHGHPDHIGGTASLRGPDVMMPYIGNPFQAEGSPEGLLETLRFIRELSPRALIQGHAPLTETFTIDVIPGLEAALTELHSRTLDDILAGRTPPPPP
ncbi:MAG TPA: MBL fold metallo-hydrolase [Streptosporangiaceae bacterium]